MRTRCYCGLTVSLVGFWHVKLSRLAQSQGRVAGDGRSEVILIRATCVCALLHVYWAGVGAKSECAVWAR